MNWFIRLITGGWAAAITLLPFGIYIQEKYWKYKEFAKNIWDRIVNHESIHWKQQKEMLFVGIFLSLITGVIFLLLKLSLWYLLLLILIPFAFFYLWYLIEWFIRLFVNWGHSYYAIGFEHESHVNEGDLNYLTNRKWFSWLKFMKYDKYDQKVQGLVMGFMIIKPWRKLILYFIYLTIIVLLGISIIILV